MAMRVLMLVLGSGGAGASALLAARSSSIRELIHASLAPPDRASTALLQELESKNVETRVQTILQVNVKKSSDHVAALAMGPPSMCEHSPRAHGLSDAELTSEQVDTKVIIQETRLFPFMKQDLLDGVADVSEALSWIGKVILSQSTHVLRGHHFIYNPDDYAAILENILMCSIDGLCESIVIYYRFGKRGSAGAPEVRGVPESSLGQMLLTQARASNGEPEWTNQNLGGIPMLTPNDRDVSSPKVSDVFESSSSFFESIFDRALICLSLRPFIGSASILAFSPSVSAVCPHCKDTIVGCAGGDRCPIVKDLAENAAIFVSHSMAKTPKVTQLLSPEIAAHFTRPVVEAVVGLACAPAVGTEIDFTSAEYRTSRSVVQAAMHGHCSVAEAADVLTGRMDAAADDSDISKIKGAMDMLKLCDDVPSAGQGTISFLWAKCTNIVGKRGDGVVRLEVGSKARSTALTVSLMRPSTESEFFEGIHYFVWVVTALGITSAFLVTRYIDDVVWGALRMKEGFKVAHELLVLYNAEIDRDSTKTVHMGNVFRRGGQDTLLSQARRNVGVFFRTGGGELRAGLPGPGDDGTTKVKWNGKFTASATKMCPEWNLGKPCTTKLDAEGTCLFNHKCNQFVSDKGPAGVCGGDHARCNGCNYDADKKLTKPASA